MDQSISRRGFVAGTAGIVGAAALGSVAAGSAVADEAEVKLDGAGYDPAGYYDDPIMGDSADPIPPVEPPAEWNDEADVVVVGLGAGGLLASQYLAKAGLKVIAIDKDLFIGGSTREATAYVAPGSQLLPWGDPNVAMYWGETPEDYLNRYVPCDRDFILSVLAGGAECMDWMIDELGMNWVRDKDADGNPGFCIQWGGIIPGENGAGGRHYHCVRVMKHATDFLADLNDQAGVDTRLGNRLTALVADEGRVVGVQVETEGTTRYIKGERGVILCTGDMCNNFKMLEKYLPHLIDTIAGCNVMPSHTGEGMRMAAGLGADFTGMDTMKAYDGCLDWYRSGAGPFYHYMYNGASALCRAFWLNINKQGKRFMKKHTGGDACALDTVMYSGQTGQRSYAIFDGNFEDYLEQMTTLMGTGMPLRPDVEGEDLSEVAAPYFMDEVNIALESGALKKADTLEELAQLVGLDPELLIAAVDKWNEYYEAGEDPEWGEIPGLTMFPIDTPPFYCAKVGAQVWQTGCGVRTTPQMEVVGTDGHVIPGLYAGSTMVGGDLGYCWGTHRGPGQGVAYSFTTGFIAAKAIIEARQE